MGCIGAALRVGWIVLVLFLGFELEPFGWFEGLTPPENLLAFVGLSALFGALAELIRSQLPRQWKGFTRASVATIAAAVPTVIVLALLEIRYDGGNSPDVASTLWHYIKLLPFGFVAMLSLSWGDDQKPVRVRKRLTLKQLLTQSELTGLFAMSAEQGKVRAYTERGERLIDSRLVDAIADMLDVDGLQIHRDWWVKRRAVTGSERTGKSISLTLVNGRSVPVGPAYAHLVRSAGLID